MIVLTLVSQKDKMKVFLHTKKYLLKVLFWLSVLLPTKIFALDYQPLESGAFDGFVGSNTTGDLGKFLSQAFQFGLAISAVLTVIMIVWGGLEIMLSESVFSKDAGKKKIRDALTGLLLALTAWLILYIINPSILDWSFLATN